MNDGLLTTPRMLTFTVWTALVAGLVSVPLGPRGAQGSQHTAAQDPLFELWQDPARFEQVSSAMQNLLTARFGPRVVRDAAGKPVTAPGSGFPSVAGPAGAPETALPNVLVNDPTADATSQDTQSETALVLGSGSHVIAAFNDSGSFIGGSHFTGWAHSSNDGATWTDPGVLPGNNDAGDPVLARDATTGRIYLTCLFFSGSGINCFRSDNDGVTWMPSVNCAPSSGSMDKEWIAVDNFPGPGQGNVYHVVRDFGGGNGVRFFRSLDQGATWGPFGGTVIASASPSNVQGAYVVVAPNHDVHAFWYDSNPSPDEIRTRRSSDFGVTWSAPVTVTTLTSTATNGSLSLVAGFRSNSFVQATVNPVSGNLYVVYNDPEAVSGGDRGNILFRQSTDGGLTWSAPTMVNDDGTDQAQYFPAIACRPDGTGLAVCWYDNRNDPNDVNIERWGVTASVSGSTVTFGPNFQISPQFVPVFGVDPVVNSVYMGDYDQMAATNTAYYTTWGDNRDDSIAVPSRKNANVRFTSFGQDGPGAALSYQSVAVGGGNGNGRIDINECVDLVVDVENVGTLPATGIVGTLSTTNPEVSIVNPAVAYPDLVPGASDSGVVPFQVSTSTAFDCAAPVEFTLTLVHDGGTDVSSFSTAGSANYQVTAGSGSIVAGTTDIGNHGDDLVTLVSLPFPVTFYSTSYTQVRLSSNGNAQFTGNDNEWTNSCLPTGTFGASILAHWDDLLTNGGGEGIFTSTTGTAPNRAFHVEWRTHYISGGGTANFELRLHEGSSDFELVYGNISQGGTSATIGCQEGSGPGSTQHSCNGGGIGSGLQLSFSLPGCPDGGGSCGGPFPPLITEVTPGFGPNTGVTGVEIHGLRFTGTTAVSFGPNAVSFTVDSDNQITADLGAVPTTGHVDVSVTTPEGTDVLVDGFDYFVPPTQIGTPCSTPSLGWKGAPILGERYTVITSNLNGASQLLLVDWSDQGNGAFARRLPSQPPCPIRIQADEIIDLGTQPGYSFDIPVDVNLIGVHLRTQAKIVSPPATTQVLDAVIGE